MDEKVELTKVVDRTSDLGHTTFFNEMKEKWDHFQAEYLCRIYTTSSIDVMITKSTNMMSAVMCCCDCHLADLPHDAKC